MQYKLIILTLVCALILSGSTNLMFYKSLNKLIPITLEVSAALNECNDLLYEI